MLKYINISHKFTICDLLEFCQITNSPVALEMDPRGYFLRWPIFHATERQNNVNKARTADAQNF